MKYKVIETFADLQDNKHVYGIGDEYPRKGYSPTAERVDELCTGKNLLHKPLIQLVVVQVPETVVEEVIETPETEEQPEEAVKVPEEAPKRRRKKSDD